MLGGPLACRGQEVFPLAQHAEMYGHCCGLCTSRRCGIPTVLIFTILVVVRCCVNDLGVPRRTAMFAEADPHAGRCMQKCSAAPTRPQRRRQVAPNGHWPSPASVTRAKLSVSVSLVERPGLSKRPHVFENNVRRTTLKSCLKHITEPYFYSPLVSTQTQRTCFDPSRSPRSNRGERAFSEWNRATGAIGVVTDRLSATARRSRGASVMFAARAFG